ncbi:hypothetical protein ACJX0J_038021, partial [Zea mays]
NATVIVSVSGCMNPTYMRINIFLYFVHVVYFVLQGAAVSDIVDGVPFNEASWRIYDSTNEFDDNPIPSLGDHTTPIEDYDLEQAESPEHKRWMERQNIATLVCQKKMLNQHCGMELLEDGRLPNLLLHLFGPEMKLSSARK